MILEQAQMLAFVVAALKHVGMANKEGNALLTDF